MDPETIRKLYKDLDPASVEEAVKTTLEARTEPDMARGLWHVLLALAPQDRTFETLLTHLLMSVVIDSIEHRMQQDDEYALVISRRITTFMEKMAPPPHGKRARTA